MALRSSNILDSVIVISDRDCSITAMKRLQDVIVEAVEKAVTNEPELFGDGDAMSLEVLYKRAQARSHL